MTRNIIWICLFCLLPEQVSSITIGNKLVSLSFDEATGRLTSFKDEVSGRELLAQTASPLWQIWLKDGSRYQPAEPIRVETLPSPNALDISWCMEDGLRVAAKIRLDENSPLVRWRLQINNVPAQANEIQFPIISGMAKTEGDGDEELAVSTWLGSLIHAPRSQVNPSRPRVSYSWQSPGSLSMQMMALYGCQGDGLYFASNDTLSYAKSYEIGFDSLTTDWRMTHYPPQNGASDYAMPYEALVGPFRGDWLSAAAIYRQWARAQRWCRESRLLGGQTPRWVLDTDLWIWNRGRSENVLGEAADLKRRTGKRVNVFWHWWHGCSYDEGFPEYLPPREGQASFVRAVGQAHRKGIHCLTYMNSFQWGNSTESWERLGAERYAARDIGGGMYSHAFNVFTGRELTPMCMATGFWRNHYASLADSVVNRYGVDGVYMDQACMNLRCYAEGHGHAPGGGNYWMSSFRKLTEQIRHRAPATLAGEGSGEDWIPALDLFLTLEASRERYLGITDIETIPLYQAVYHDCAITFGSYSSLVYPPYDDLWPDEFRPQNRETSLPDEFNMQFRMEQARAFVWGMQPTLANYHGFLWDEKPREMEFLMRLVAVRHRALKYLLHGVYTRVPPLEVPRSDISLSRISIYAGRTGSTVTSATKSEPTIYSGAWRAADGSVALALANISDEEWTCHLRFPAAEYDIPQPCRIYVIGPDGRRRGAECSGGMVEADLSLAPRDVQVVEFVPSHRGKHDAHKSANKNAQSETTLRLTNRQQQTIDGFGASDAWSMWKIGTWEDSLQAQVADWLFSSENFEDGSPQGIGLSIWRFNAGAGSATQGDAAQINPDTRTEHFAQQTGQRRFLRLARERGVPTFLAFYNSPPIHLTQNGLATNTGRGGTLNLRPDAYDDFAAYIADMLQAAEREDGIHFDYVCPVNEPDGHWNWQGPKQEGSPATNREIAHIAREMDKEFTRRGITTKILVNESSDLRCMLSTHMTNWQRGNEIQCFWNPDSADTYVGNLSHIAPLLAGHSYWTNTPVLAPGHPDYEHTGLYGYRRQLKEAFDRVGADFWMTELCIMSNDDEIHGGGGFDFSMEVALYVARIIHYDLTVANARSWQWWRAAGGDYKDGLIRFYSAGEHPSSQHGMRKGAIRQNRVRDSKLLWTLGNYSRFVRPGAVRLEMKGEMKPDGVMCSAYRNIDGSTAIVAINYSKEAHILHIKGTRKKTARAYRTSDIEGENLKHIGSASLRNLELPARSVTTLLY